MNINFVPSLQHIALIKVAIAICNDPEVIALEEELKFPISLLPSKALETLYNESSWFYLSWPLIEKLLPWMKPKSAKIKRRSQEEGEISCESYWDSADKPYEAKIRFPLCILSSKRWEKLILKKAANFSIAKNLQKQLVDVVRYLFSEIEKWKQDHDPIVSSYASLPSSFHWKSCGIIDWLKTARTLIRDESIHIANRFILACYYCLDDEIERLWSTMKDYEKDCFSEVNSSVIAKVWTSWIARGVSLNWNRIAYGYPDSPLGLRGFFTKLTPTKKQEWLTSAVRFRSLQYDDLCFCLSHIDENVKEKLFEACSRQILEYFLEWPMQPFFLRMAACLWKYLDEKEFQYLLDVIVYQRILVGWCGFNYIELLREFWNQSTAVCKEYVMMSSFYPSLKIIIDYDYKKPFPKKELVQSNEQDYLFFTSLGIRFMYFIGKFQHLTEDNEINDIL
ncbi:uncharacterized protein TNCT_366801 [Trichonephila clavata]|uniref:Uncharacterized protein n=1 Tax=Trichonephila clavata TaxID=2740835 RepID=A0A8X6HWM3_TRICU|nr:uncharacterized protein TNCT_366801 [Trichonephila clavata]